MNKGKKWFAKNKKYGYLLIILVVVFVVSASLFDFSQILIVNETKRAQERTGMVDETERTCCSEPY